jgi:hypothetical protein
MDPVVGPAWEAPVPDRGRQGHGLAVEDQPPLPRAKRGYDLIPTAARAEVDCRGIWNRDVEDSIPEVVGDVIDEDMREPRGRAQPRSSLISLFPAIVYAEKCSCSRSA